MTEPIRLATRRSQLALAQSRRVAAALERACGHPVELVTVVSQGDTDPGPLTAIGGAGVFVAAVREAVLEGRADVAVHSLKDLPTAAAPGLELAAVPVREDARDVLCATAHHADSPVPAGESGQLPQLRFGARVGTGSPRRAAQLRTLRPDLEVVDIRGNVDTRLARVGEDLDAVVLAAAGLARLGRPAAPSAILSVDTMLPAPGQGALALEVHQGAPREVRVAVSALDDPATRAATMAERSMLAALEAGCSAPVGAFAETAEPGYWEPEIFLRGGVFAAGRAVRMSVTGSVGSAEELGRELAASLLASGAGGLMTESNT